MTDSFITTVLISLAIIAAVAIVVGLIKFFIWLPDVWAISLIALGAFVALWKLVHFEMNDR